jgi:hypothetical protein
MQPWKTEPLGRFEQHVVDSQALRGNPLSDPHRRPLWVYLPPGIDPEGRYPSIYVLQGLTGQVDMWWNRPALRPTVPERIDSLFAAGSASPAIVVLVDAWTSLGGSQYVNSPGTGRYLDYLCDEVVPFGDALFEHCYLPDLAKAARALRDRYEGSYDRFWADFRSRPAFGKDDDDALLNTYCMAACYSAEPDGTVTLPFEATTGRLRDAVWQRWLALDPVRMASQHAEELRSLRGIYLDAGKQDEYYLDLGAAAFAAELDALGVEHTFELFDAGHMAIEYRYPRALAFLAERLAVG